MQPSLGGPNTNVSLDSKDSFGTSVASALPRFKKGGDLYANAQRVLGDIPAEYTSSPPPHLVGAATPPPREQGNKLGASLLNLIKNTGLGAIFKPQSSINPYEELLDPQSYLQVFANRLMEGEEV
jgi:hypothetical protein